MGAAPKNGGCLAANKSSPTFAPTPRCKPFICLTGKWAAVAEKSDDYSSVDNNLLVLPSCGRVGLNATLDSCGDDKCYLPFNLVVPP
jgi:hypothetical protein